MKKKIMMLLLVGAMTILGLTACGGGDDKVETTKTKSVEEKDSEDTKVEEEKIKDTKVEEEETDEFNFSDLESEMVEAYMGVLESEEAIYYSGNADGSLGILAILDPDTSQNASFVGPIKQVSDTMLTITDEESELQLTFEILSSEDGTLVIDLGDEMGKGVIAECKVSEVLEALQTISEYTETVNP